MVIGEYKLATEPQSMPLSVVQLAQILAPFIESKICVHPQNEINDNICVQFSKEFYHELAENESDNQTRKFRYSVMRFVETARVSFTKIIWTKTLTIPSPH